MVKTINFLFMVLVLVLASCGSISYKYYHLVPTEDGKLEGNLIAEKQKDDSTLEKECRDVNGKIKCVVLTLDEYKQLYEDLLTTRQLLEDCERRLP